MKDKLPTEKPKKKNNILFKTVICVAVVLLGLHLFNMSTKTDVKVPVESITSLVKKIDNNQISSLTLIGGDEITKKIQVLEKNGRNYSLTIPNGDNDIIVTKAIKNDIPLVTLPPSSNLFWEIFMVWGPVTLIGGIIIWSIFAQRRERDNMLRGGMSVAENKAKLINPKDITTGFNEVIGCDSAKKEVAEVVEFLKEPNKFIKNGARIPRGILLVGPAGTGKTMLAKAIAKESNVPFFSTSGSEFMEMFVGVGAARVRSMFEQAKEKAPCVLFIDEIDAIGGKRGFSAQNGGNGEREQTLNQILVELDGLDTNKTVILIAATNRPETLDDALLRPGRIDRQVTVDLPDVKGREEMLKLYTKNVPIRKDVKLGSIALGTPGFSGAELANLVNEAAIFSVRQNSPMVGQEHFEEAKSKIMMGLERPNLSMTEDEKRETAYHEAGHAVIARLLAANGGADPVHKVTIIPRGRALGLTVQLPEKERHSYDMRYLKNRITILMGGRAAEEIFCNQRTAGASNDIMVATNTAKSMVCEWGMSKLGPVAFGRRGGNQYLSGGGFQIETASEKMAEAVENEISDLINNEYEHAMKLLIDNRDIMEAMTQALMEVETIEEWHIDNLMARRHYLDQQGLTEYEARYNKKFPSAHLVEEPDVVEGADLEINLSDKQPEPQQTVTPATA